MLQRAQMTTDPTEPIAALIGRGDYLEALRMCAKEHGLSIGRLCIALLGDQHDADEALQETLLAAHKSMPGYRGDGSVRAWLFGIARRQCARRLAVKQKGRANLRLVVDATGSSEDPEREALLAERARRLRSALGVLKPTEREALLLRYTADLSFREIADICGIEEATARKRASRGLQRLRGAIKPEEL